MAHLALVACALIAARMDGQTAAPAFDVASVRQVLPPYPSGGGPWTVTHGRFKATNGWVRGVIAWAYGVLTPQVRGGPSWIDSDLYDFDARSDQQDAGPQQVQTMLQALLADRFKLVAHKETQEIQAYTLTIGKGGSKMEEAKEGTRNYINWTGSGQVEFVQANMLGLINVLSAVLSSPVIDNTGQKGLYNFKLEFTDPRVPQAPGAAGDSRPSLFTAVQDQLGLKLESKKGPAEVLVIDRMERPSEN